MSTTLTARRTLPPTDRPAPTPSTAARPGADDPTLPPDDLGRRRVAIERLTPNVDGGRFPVKRVVGDTVKVEVDAFADGHDVVEATLLHRRMGDADWTESTLEGPDNDHWWGTFEVDRLGKYRYTVRAWVDRLATWARDLERRLEGGQDVSVDLLIGAELAEAAAARAEDVGATADGARLLAWAANLRTPGIGADPAPARATGLDADALAAGRRHPDLRQATVQDPPFEVVVERERAAFSSWYELFPRSASPDPKRHGTLQDVVDRLPYIRDLGFDIVYLPPIHPVGRAFRKGPNNVVTAGPADPGSPWAIGSAEGGHTAVNPALGTLADVRALAAAARRYSLELALDIAFQASPDHPWIREHPAWFRHRPDGSIQYAENPPKKYQDIVPFDFETDDWRALWEALRSVIRFWIAQGIAIFRVDNPHTKPFPFWEWLISTVQADHPETIFLAEAFTAPKAKYRLAKLGFSQSYTYFTWRNTPQELAAYVEELVEPERLDFFRPNFWPNTPDILHADLVRGGRPAFMARFVLAATLSSNYGIYGPAFELGVNVPREEGSEEYRDSEKYEQRAWDLEDPRSLRDLIRTVNGARRAHPALQRTDGVTFLETDNPHLLAYRRSRGDDAVVGVVSFDFANPQGGWVDVGPSAFGRPAEQRLEVVDVISGSTTTWQGERQRIDLDPMVCPAALFQARDRERRT